MVRANNLSIDSLSGSVDDNLLPCVTEGICALESAVVEHSIIVKLLNVGYSCERSAWLPVVFE